VASALPINDALVQAGSLYSNLDAQFTFSSYSQSGGTLGPTNPFAPDAATAATQDSKVIVQAGAVIQTPLSPTNNGGRVILIGPEVINAGTIRTPDGQTILAAGQQVGLIPHPSTDPSLRGLDVFVGSVQAPVAGIAPPDLSNPSQVSSLPPTGTATNSGLIEADRGNITIAGANVYQLGTALSTTSVSLNGRIDLSATYNYRTQTSTNSSGTVVGASLAPSGFGVSIGPVTLGPGSLTQIVPELASTDTVAASKLTLPSDPTVTGPLASQVNITGLAVYMGQNAELYAPGGQAKIDAGTGFAGAPQATVGQIYIDSGALIDVSGSINISAPVTQNVIAVQLFGAQLADSPLQHNGPLRGQTVYVDVRQTGTNADGSAHRSQTPVVMPASFSASRTDHQRRLNHIECRAVGGPAAGGNSQRLRRLD
jgi:hypothetical protein